MAATALIKYTQDALVGADGEALFGEVGTEVTVENAGDNTDVKSWQIDMLYVDPRSGTLEIQVPYAFNNNSAVPLASFIPDVPGAYRLRLQVWDVLNRAAAVAKSTDIRVFGIKETNGLFAPPAQIWPRPLPPPESGEPSAKPHEMNFGGQAYGWAGTGTDGLLNTLIRNVDRLNVITDSIAAQQNDYTPANWTTTDILRLTAVGAQTITGFGPPGTLSTRVERKRIDNVSSTVVTIAHLSGSSAAGNKVVCPYAVDFLLGPGCSVYIEYNFDDEVYTLLEAGALSKQGGTMAGAVDMGGFELHNFQSFGTTSALALTAGAGLTLLHTHTIPTARLGTNPSFIVLAVRIMARNTDNLDLGWADGTIGLYWNGTNLILGDVDWDDIHLPATWQLDITAPGGRVLNFYVQPAAAVNGSAQLSGWYQPAKNL